MATQDDCWAAIVEVVDRFNTYDVGKKRQRIPARSVGCTILDLDVTFAGRIVDGFLVDVEEQDVHEADIRVICSSDDLVDLVAGRINFAQAWSTGRVRLDASLRDLMRLRSLA